jgi:hypothetical protein
LSTLEKRLDRLEAVEARSSGTWAGDFTQEGKRIVWQNQVVDGEIVTLLPLHPSQQAMVDAGDAVVKRGFIYIVVDAPKWPEPPTVGTNSD